MYKEANYEIVFGLRGGKIFLPNNMFESVKDPLTFNIEENEENDNTLIKAETELKQNKYLNDFYKTKGTINSIKKSISNSVNAYSNLHYKTMSEERDLKSGLKYRCLDSTANGQGDESKIVVQCDFSIRSYLCDLC